MDITQNPFKIIVKPNASKNRILGYNKEKKAYKVEINAKPNNNKANIEIIKYFSKLLKKQVKIIKGIKNKEKILKMSETFHQS
jgi:uncharacterized protein (TIGR00251 family)